MRRASHEWIVRPGNARSVIVISGWPWVGEKRRRRILAAILCEARKRSMVDLHPCCITRSAYVRMQKAIDDAELMDRRKYDA